MKKLVFLLIPLLTSCSVTYVEVYHIQKEPVTWCETIYVDPVHWHYRGLDNVWSCVEIPSDTIDIIINDTIVEKTYMGTYKKKEQNIKWNLKKFKCDGEQCH
jgi:hypothetical protein